MMIEVTTMAGSTGGGVPGHRDGEGTVAQFKQPWGLAVDWDGNLIVADSDCSSVHSSVHFALLAL
jgi:hypothetical protein